MWNGSQRKASTPKDGRDHFDGREHLSEVLEMPNVKVNIRLALLLLGLVLVAGCSSGSDPKAHDDGSPSAVTLTSAADPHGHSRVLNRQSPIPAKPKVMGVTNKLAKQFPDDYLGSIIPKESGTVLRVLFTGKAPARALALLGDLDLPIEVVDSVGISGKDVRTQPGRAGDALAAKGLQCTVYFDLRELAWVVSCDNTGGNIDDVETAVRYLTGTAPVHIDMGRGAVVPAD